MKRLSFTCTLLSDVILNQRAATAGNQSTLDFIPGGNFLGIVAGKLYGSSELSDGDKALLFHSGAVRYGDAHPLSADGARSLRVPAALFYPKLKAASDECYVHHHIPAAGREALREKQLKQCREGFYAFAGGRGQEVGVERAFAIKSAYDSATRRSEDKRMYGYQSLVKGLVMGFEVEIDTEAEHLAAQVEQALTGRQHVGRSRTAQYGLVDIAPREPWPDLSRPTPAGGLTTVYADSRLIFLDQATGEPTFRPTAGQLGLDGGEVAWELSQVRTFQYAPWNGKRMTRDTDRCGIEKGSVLVVRHATAPGASASVGNYRSEGFGRVIYNPEFLDADACGRATVALLAADTHTTRQASASPAALLASDVALLQHLGRRQQRAQDLNRIYSDVNEFVSNYASRFRQATFASQWGSVRTIATRMDEADGVTIWRAVKHFLCHGVAQEKWQQAGRLRCLEDFANKYLQEGTPRLLREALVNLGAEMGKNVNDNKARTQ